MKRIITNLTEVQLESIDKLIKQGFYKSRSEAIRKAILILLEKAKMEEIKKELGE